MKIEERVELYKKIFKNCKAIEPVANMMAKGYKKKSFNEDKLELLRELDTDLAEVYGVFIPVITCYVRDNSYVRETKEIFLGEPELVGFLHQFRHHLQNEARAQERRHLLVEDNTDLDYRLPYREAVHPLFGEDDAVAWSKMIMESI